jgi:hypothetical protein
MRNWWVSPDANPHWRPPRLANPRPLDRLRDKLDEIIADESNGEQWLKALAELLPGEAIEAFLDHKQMTAAEIRVISGFVGEFGQDMASGRLIRRGHATPVPPVSRVPQARSGATWLRLWR